MQARPIWALPFVIGFGTAVVLAPSHQLTLTAAGLVGISAAWALAHRSGVDPTGGWEMMAVFPGSLFLMALPIAFQTPVPRQTWPAVGLGILAIETVWASHRYPILRLQRVAPIGQRVATGAMKGLMVAAGIAILASIPIGIGLLSPASRSETLRVAPLVYAGYAVGGLAAGGLIGALRPLTRYPAGTILVGILGGMCVYGAVMPAVAATRPVKGAGEAALVALIGGLLAGPPAALGWRYCADNANLFAE